MKSGRTETTKENAIIFAAYAIIFAVYDHVIAGNEGISGVLMGEIGVLQRENRNSLAYFLRNLNRK